MSMPRLSLYRNEKGNDYEFIDKQIYEMFTVGGTDINVHKYIGTDDGETIKDTAQIQDMLFLENRDRKYDTSVYTMRGMYNVQDIDFDLSQFGLFLSNDTLFMTIHIKGSVKSLGRKIINGDVIELPHLKDEYALNDFSTALKRYYVVEDVNRAAEGFSPTWYPHLYRIKMKQLVDSQEFKDILERPENDDVFEGEFDENAIYSVGQTVRYKGTLYEVVQETAGNLPTDTNYWKEYEENTLRDLLSTYEKEMQINNAVLSEAESDARLSGYDISHYFTLAVDKDGRYKIANFDTNQLDENSELTADMILGRPERQGYHGYLITEDEAPNGLPFGIGTAFPQDNEVNDYFLRTDFLPNRLFRYTGEKWVKMYDNVRMTMTNGPDRQTQLGTFINNDNTDNIAGDTVPERQSLSKVLRPKADN